MERMGLAPGTELGGYRVLAPLGQGGMGAVYRAVDADGVGVALKLLHAHLADGAARDRLAREVAALQKVRHVGVARVLDAELDSAEAFVVTELVEGSDLASSVTVDGPLGTTRVADLADLAEQLADALDAVHAAGLLHRDLTPGNVMVTDDGPVLIDFGIAQVVEDARLTSAGQVAGTPGYLSPELLAGAEPARRDDWWGWAAVLAFAATGRPPFGVRPLAAVLARVSSGHPDLAGIDPRVAAVLAGALVVDPAQRTTARTVVAALREIAERGDAGTPGLLTSDDAVAWGQGPGGTRVLDASPAARPTGGPPPPYAPGDAAVTEVVDARGPEVEAWQPHWAATQDPDGGVEDDAGPWADDPAAPDGAPSAPDVLPDPPRRTGTVLALGVLALVAGTSWPGVTLLAVVVLAVLVRSIGLDTDGLHARQARRGVRRTDTLLALATWPWYLLRGLLGVLPALLVAASAFVLVGGLGWWLLGSGRTVLVAAAPGEESLLGANAPWVASALVALAVLVALLTLWFGPAGSATRRGARWTLHGVAPRSGGAVVLVFLALAGAAVLAASVYSGQPIEWWPLSGPPSL